MPHVVRCGAARDTVRYRNATQRTASDVKNLIVLLHGLAKRLRSLTARCGAISARSVGHSTTYDPAFFRRRPNVAYGPYIA